MLLICTTFLSVSESDQEENAKTPLKRALAMAAWTKGHQSEGSTSDTCTPLSTSQPLNLPQSLRHPPQPQSNATPTSSPIPPSHLHSPRALPLPLPHSSSNPPTLHHHPTGAIRRRTLIALRPPLRLAMGYSTGREEGKGRVGGIVGLWDVWQLAVWGCGLCL